MLEPRLTLRNGLPAGAAQEVAPVAPKRVAFVLRPSSTSASGPGIGVVPGFLRATVWTKRLVVLFRRNPLRVIETRLVTFCAQAGAATICVVASAVDFAGSTFPTASVA